MSATWFDHAIATVAPRMAARRVMARQAFETLTRGYDGAARGRRRDGDDGGGVFPRRDRGAGRVVVGIGIGGVGIVLRRMVGGRGFRLGRAARLARRGSSGGLGDDAGVALEPGF